MIEEKFTMRGNTSTSLINVYCTSQIWMTYQKKKASFFEGISEHLHSARFSPSISILCNQVH